MHRWSKRIAQFATLALAAGLLVAPIEAHAQTAYRVQVGAALFNRSGGAPADGMRFLAPPMRVHQGDTIRFRARGFHTATLLPAGTDVSSWVEDNASGLSDPFSLVVLDPDEGTNARPGIKANNAAIFPSDDTCGDAANPCPYNGQDVVNSGVPFESPDFHVLIDAPPGSNVWVVCLVHASNMRFRLRVVDDTAATTTQEAIDRYRARTVAKDADEANALHHRLLSRQTRHRTATGRLVWDAYAGYDGPGFSLLGMYPKRMVVKRGQVVKWHFQQMLYEDHTVTFPFKRGVRISNGVFTPACDPDGDAGPGPDNPPDTNQPPFCNDPSQLEFEIPAALAFPAGNTVHRSGRDFDHSGIEGSNFHAGKDPYRLRFAKVSRRKGFRYMCAIHGGFMSGRVIVKPRR
jgi:plastocyanin